ncbi:oligosaccharide flippase family protein [Haladaptatus salinisoli]|uniref:oligosaccharide flippase family protein n=1 Tax=Haladaptatus salinisoli TaxID=2884876 RepID=UPI001D0AB5CC|nr:lipopolysaccharide biosynthesis protein [Haladaptatus salinisoli]
MTTDATDVSLSGETAKATVAKFTMALSGFVGTVLFARLLGPVSFGGFYLLLGVVKIADRPIHGWTIAAKKRFSEHRVRDEAVVGSQAVFIAVWLVVIGVGSLTFSEELRDYTGLVAAPVLFLVLLASEPLYEPFEKLLQGRGQIGVATWIDTLRSYLTLPLQLGFVLTGFGVAGMVYGLAGATVLSIPVVLYFLRTPPELPSYSLLRSLWEYAKYSIPSSFFGTIYDRFDVLLLGLLLTPAAAGYYEVAAKLTLPAVFVGSTAASGLMARVSANRSKGKEVADDVTNTLAFTSVLAIPIFFGALAIPTSLIITVYGSEYAPAATLLVGIAGYRLLKSQNAPLTQTVNGLDNPEMTMRISAIALTVNIVVGVVLVLRVGPVGVVLATLLAEVIRYLWLAVVVRRSIPNVKLLPSTLIEQIGAGFLMFLIVSVTHGYLPVRSWTDLSLLLLVGASTYGFALLAISTRLRHTIGSVLRGSRIEQFVPRPILKW